MPPKRQPNTKPQGKVEVAQKVKEIKQRQQNWLKQREQSATLERTDECSDTSKAGGHGDISQNKGPGFNAWMKARNKEERPALREQRKTPLGASYVISSKDNNQEEEVVHQHNVLAHGAPTSTGTGYSSSSLAPDDFDQLADQILTRVKKELNGKPYYAKQYEDLNPSVTTKETKTHAATNKYSSQGVHHGNNTAGSQQQQETPSPDILTVNHQGNNYPEGHLCPQCTYIMIGDNEPMLIIPCGHNICKACSELEDVDFCAVCSCEVGSFTSNIMLKQIIGDYKRGRKKIESSRKLAGARSSQQVEDDEKDYKEEIKTLMIRLDVLETESDNIKETMNSIQREIAMEKKQVSNIERQEDKIKEEMDELHAKLDALSNHKQGYFERCEALDQKSLRQEEKLTMVKDTIRQLNREVEKLQLTGGGNR